LNSGLKVLLGTDNFHSVPKKSYILLLSVIIASGILPFQGLYTNMASRF
jgi:hypothetical protein